MNIVVLGDTGMIGSRAVAGAKDRGHHVTGYSRGGQHALNFSQTTAVVEIIDDPTVDVTIIAVVTGRTGSYADDITNHAQLIAAAPTGRFIVVGGAGGLQADEKTLLVDTPEFPAAYQPESEAFVEILQQYRNAEDLNWTMLAPAPVIVPGQRTGTYQVGQDYPAGQEISAEDFAVALIDEAENPQHSGTRFTVAN